MVVQLVPAVVSCITPRVLANVRLVHVVSPLVVITVTAGSESFGAISKTTSVWLLAIVHPKMLLQITLLVECFIASLLSNRVLPFAKELGSTRCWKYLFHHFN